MTDSEPDIVAAHATLARRDVLQDDRRALFAVAAELAGAGSSIPESVLDNPVTRAALGSVLAGAAALDAADLRPLDDLGARAVPAGSQTLQLVYGELARTALADALSIVGVQAAAVDPGVDTPSLLLAADGTAFERAAEIVTAGVDVIRAADVALADDLFPHVALIALLADGTSGRLGSASAREYPGLVLLPTPKTAVEAAEALVHEGAHLKFFDLGLTRDLLGRAAHAAPAYRPSWSGRETQWPLEQVFAAWHAYTCLARFWDQLDDSVRALVAGDSLLPMATVRAAELLDRLLGCGTYLGKDAHRLLTAVSRQNPAAPPALPAAVPAMEVDRRVADGAMIIRRVASSGRTVVGQAGRPPEIYWIDCLIPDTGSTTAQPRPSSA